MKVRCLLLPLVLLGLLPAPGCFLRGPADIRREVSQRADLDLDREVGFRVGRFGMFLARKAVRLADAEEDLPVTLKGVRKVEVGIYRVRGSSARRALSRAAARPSLCSARFDGWDLTVRVCEREEHVLLFTRLQGEAIRGVLVVVQDPEEVVIVRARGRLDLLLEEVMEMAHEQGGLLARRDPDRDEAPRPAPAVPVCESDELPAAQVTGAALGCVAPEEARERVLAVARLLTPADVAGVH